MEQTMTWIYSDPQAEYPFCREDSFERKLRRHRLRQTALTDFISEETTDDYLDQSEINTILENAHLTEKQLLVLERYLLGCTLQEIGEEMHITKQAVAKTLGFALKKVRQSRETAPYRGLAEVYRSEVNRRYCLMGNRKWK